MIFLTSISDTYRKNRIRKEEILEIGPDGPIGHCFPSAVGAPVSTGLSPEKYEELNNGLIQEASAHLENIEKTERVR